MGTTNVILDNTATSRALHARAQATMPGGNTRTTVHMSPYPIYAQRGEGCHVIDVDGNAYLDCINNFTAAIHGHAHPALMRAAAEQLASGTAFGLPTESEIALAELLCGRAPSIEQIRFTNSGTEAVMTALKAARAFTGRPMIAKCEGAYHGSYDYAEVSLDPGPERWGGRAPSPVAYARGTPERVLADTLVLPFNDVEESARLIEAHADRLAAVLIDPMPNRAGLAPASADYLATLRDLTRAQGIVFIFDEVITFRLGYGGAQERFGVHSDLTTLGKIIGGGFPVGAVGGRADIMAVFDPSKGKPAMPHGGTFTANPMTMRAGLAAMELLTPHEFARLERLGDRVRQGIDAAFGQARLPGSTTGLGSLIRLHLTSGTVRDYRSVFAGPEERTRMDALFKALLARGVLMAPNGLMALSTPMTEADADRIVSAVADSLAAIH
jgi:glutamate-1-semialdehyde 2,1-aminomutase